LEGDISEDSCIVEENVDLAESINCCLDDLLSELY
jgi:hypothetical protein